VSFRWIDDESDLLGLLDELIDEPRYALDTEFHRERTYFPRLALVQIAWSGGIALIDPLAVSAERLTKLFDTDAVAVFHAAQQDLDVLTHAVGCVPRVIYDTQVAAGFIGYATPSLVELVRGELGHSPAKGDRLTDWLQRPLTAEQRDYAAADVLYLLDLQDRLDAKLIERGRLAWVAEAFEELRSKPVVRTTPEDAWTRLKDAKSLRPKARAIAQAVAAWRERDAQALDIPVRQVLSDLAVLGIAQRQPHNLDELGQCRGVDERHRRGRIGKELLAVVESARHAPPPKGGNGGEDLDRSLRPALTLISAWVSHVARSEHIDTALLATRSDLVALLAGDADARLHHGWRAELVGDGIERLLVGRAGLTFDGHHGLRMIDVTATGLR
jgi:ribonuclease D